MKKIYGILLGVTIQAAAFAQTTLFLKPGPSGGDNTTIMTTYGCTPTGYPGPAETLNAGTVSEMVYSDWTYNAAGCSHGTIRGLIRFNGLSAIPPTATILSATLNLYGEPSSPSYGNSTFPGSPYPLSNDGVVSIINDPWNISTVTWNMAPTYGMPTTPIPTTSLPIVPTGAHWNWNTSVNVQQMVQQMVTSGNNYGFMLTLQTEAYYRAAFYAGNGHPDSSLWPELKVVYCDAGFSYCSSTSDPYTFDFSANAPGLNQWLVDGTPVGAGPVLSYSFPGPGSYTVCQQIYDQKQNPECEYCVKICVDDNGKQTAQKQVQSAGKAGNVLKMGSLPIGDKEALQINSVSPNPTSSGWNVAIYANAANSGKANITLYDLSGKVISQQNVTLNPGKNTFYQNGSKLAPGTYMIEINNGAISMKEKAVKK